MEIILYSAALLLGFVLLVKGADYFVEGAASVAAKLGIPEIVIGLTIVAMGTSSPEMAVSITAALTGSADITIGNVVGSNILNILLILGITAVMTAVSISQSTIRYEIPFMIGCSVLILLQGLDQTIDFKDGIVLWLFFGMYLTYLFVSTKAAEQEPGKPSVTKGWIQVLYVIGGLSAIVLGSKCAVYGATRLAQMCGISERLIGLTIVAFGTSLPELFTSVTAAKKGNADIAIGNIVGSNIFNILFIIGTTACIKPVTFDAGFHVDSYIMIVAGIMLLLCSVRKKKLTRLGGIIMLLSYSGYFGYLCYMD